MKDAEEIICILRGNECKDRPVLGSGLAHVLELFLERIKALEQPKADSWEALIRALVRKWQAEIDLADSYSGPSSFMAQGRIDQLRICIEELRALLK